MEALNSIVILDGGFVKNTFKDYHLKPDYVKIKKYLLDKYPKCVFQNQIYLMDCGISDSLKFQLVKHNFQVPELKSKRKSFKCQKCYQISSTFVQADVDIEIAVTFALHGLVDPQIKNIFLFAGDGDFIRTVEKIASYPGKRLIIIGADSQNNISTLLRSKAHEHLDVSKELATSLALDRESIRSRSPPKNAKRDAAGAKEEKETKEEYLSLFENLQVKNSPLLSKKNLFKTDVEIPPPMKLENAPSSTAKMPSPKTALSASSSQSALGPVEKPTGYYASDDDDKHDSEMIGRMSAAFSTRDGHSSQDLDDEENLSSELSFKFNKKNILEDKFEAMNEEEFFGMIPDVIDINGAGMVVLGTTTWKDEYPNLAIRVQNNSDIPIERLILRIGENYLGVSQAKSKIVFPLPISPHGGTETIVISLRTENFRAPILVESPISDDHGIQNQVPIHLTIRSKYGFLQHECSLPAHIFFEDEGILSKDDFLNTWKDASSDEEFEISIQNCSKVFFREDLLIAHLAEISVNIVTRTSSQTKGTRLFMSAKLLGQFILMVINLKEEQQSMKISCRSEEDKEHIAQAAALAVTGYLAQFQEG